jgi:hypothetical protein
MPMLNIAGFTGQIVFDTLVLQEQFKTAGVAMMPIGQFSIKTVPDSVTFEYSVGIGFDAGASIFVAWKDQSLERQPVDQNLRDIVNCAKDIIPMFDGFF